MEQPFTDQEGGSLVALQESGFEVSEQIMPEFVYVILGLGCDQTAALVVSRQSLLPMKPRERQSPRGGHMVESV